MPLTLTSNQLRSQLCRSQLDACDQLHYWKFGTIVIPENHERVLFSDLQRYFPNIQRVDTGRKGIHAFCDDDGLIHTIFQRRSSGQTIAWTLDKTYVKADRVAVTRKPLAALLNTLAEERRELFCGPLFVKIKQLNDSLPPDVLDKLNPRGVSPMDYFRYNSAITLPAHAPYHWSVQIRMGLQHPVPPNFAAFRFADGTWINNRSHVACMLAPELLWGFATRQPAEEAVVLYLKPHIPLKSAIAQIERLKPTKDVCLL